MGEHIALFGAIVYRDDAELIAPGDSRRIITAYFAYWYDPGANRFIRAVDPDYNEE